jgi:hypothetical protein
MSILSPGASGAFAEPEWSRDLLPQVCDLLQRQGTIANGNCGPAAGYGVLHGEAATVKQAAQLRRDVLAWSETTEGQAYYAEHTVSELQQIPAALVDMQELWSRDRAWVSPEFFTMLGGMAKLNIFLLSRTISDDSSVHCGIRLVTNGGLLIKTDDDNMGCVYFQCRLRQQTGHFEVVTDRQGRARWGADDAATVCLWSCMERARMARSVRDSRKKMLVAANNRINLANETFQPGDCAWLTVPEDVVKKATTALKKLREQQAVTEAKMLVRIVRIHAVAAQEGSAPLPTQHFVLCTEDGILRGMFSIDQLQLCYPQPERTMYRVVELDLSSLNNKAPIKLTNAYKRYIRLVSHRAAILKLPAAISPSMSVRQESALSPPQLDVAPASTSSSTAQHTQQQLLQLTTQRSAFTVAVSSPTKATRSHLQLQRAEAQRVDLTSGSITSSQPVLYPCKLCDVTMEPHEYTFCYYTPCQAPFHKPGAGCSKWSQVVVVDSTLYFCRQACAALDNSNGAGPPSSTRALTPARAASMVVDMPAPPSVLDAPIQYGNRAKTILSSQPAVAIGSGRLCNSCHEPVQWSAGAGCMHCGSYHHKIRRGEVGCTRPAWSKEGSRSVDGMIQCVPCRYRDDVDWRRFSKDSRAPT